MSDYPVDSLRPLLDDKLKDVEEDVVIVLPSLMRGGDLLYSEFDALTVRNARREGVRADLLHAPEQRRYQHEFGAEWVLEFAVALPVDLTVEGVKILARFVMAQLRGAVLAGLVRDEEVPKVKVEVVAVERAPTGHTTLKGVTVSGSGADVVQALLALAAPSDQISEIMRSLTNEQQQQQDEEQDEE